MIGISRELAGYADDLRRYGEPGTWVQPERLVLLAAKLEALVMRAEALEQTAFAAALAQRRVLETTASGKVVVGPWGLR